MCSDSAFARFAALHTITLSAVTVYKKEFLWLEDSTGLHDLEPSTLTSVRRSDDDSIAIRAAGTTWTCRSLVGGDLPDWMYAAEVALRVRGDVALYVKGKRRGAGVRVRVSCWCCRKMGRVVFWRWRLAPGV